MKDPFLAPVTVPLSEARRHVDNAKQFLKEHGNLNPDHGGYKMRKSVRSAGNVLWLAVVTALDALLQNNHSDHCSDVDIDEYKLTVAQYDRTLSDWTLDAYNIMRLSMGCDGVQCKNVCDEGFRLATEIIERCAAMLTIFRPSRGEFSE